MDFFGRQQATRRLSRQLVLLFIAAVVAVVVAVNAVILLVVRVLEPGQAGSLVLDAAWISAHGRLVFWTTLIVGAVIGIASLYKTAVLAQGGGAVARSLGGEQIAADTTDPSRRRLLNVVEEMAIASGVPMPQVYVLDHELGINAFAAGHNPANAAIAVTRGALTQLDRTELQGVIAHEFSHILNGDMRLNIRMMGLLFGLLALTVIARLVLRAAPRSSGRKGGGAVAVVLLAAFAVMLLGYIGLFFGRLIQAALSRSRESLADASAVQFTRDPQGLRNALVKIGATATGSALVDSDAEEVAHMLFAPGVHRWFATHPPLIERIRTLDPAFSEREFVTVGARLAATDAPPPDETGHALSTADKLTGLISPAVVTPAAVANLVGNPGTAHVQLAQVIRTSLPATVVAAAQNPRQAVALLLAFTIDADPAVRTHQLEVVDQVLASRAAQAVAAWLPEVDLLEAFQRLPAFLRLFPSIQQFSKLEKEKLTACFAALLNDRQRVSLHTYAFAKLAHVQLIDELEPRARIRGLTLDAVADELQIVFSVLAAHGSEEKQAARHAYEIGMHHLLPKDRPAYAAPVDWPGRLNTALDRLDDLRPVAKELLIEALVKTIANDLKLTVAEAELLRTICAGLHCPLPPLLKDAAAT